MKSTVKKLGPGKTMRVAATLVLSGVAALAVASPASATPATATRVPPTGCGTVAPGSLLVVLVRQSAKNQGFEATGPYADLHGPFVRLVNYSTCRVWLHQNSNPFGRGWSLCVNPRAEGDPAVSYTLQGKYEDAGSIVISGNFARCP
jgi:hypothetical protein